MTSSLRGPLRSGSGPVCTAVRPQTTRAIAVMWRGAPDHVGVDGVEQAHLGGVGLAQVVDEEGGGSRSACRGWAR